MLQANIIYSFKSHPDFIEHKKEECLNVMKNQIFNLIKDGGSFHFHGYKEEEKDFNEFYNDGNKIYSIYLKYENIYYNDSSKDGN